MSVHTQEMNYTTTTEADFDNDNDVIPMTPGFQVPSAIGLSLLIIIGISGNVLTVAAYFKDRHSTTVYDFFIVNLAFTDLILCCSSMPFYAVYTLMEFTWPFGYSFCKVWLVVDFTFCFETILLMLILSLDRLLMVSMGPTYIQKVTQRIACIEIAISWIISFLLYGPAIIGWNHWVGYSTVEYMDCDLEFAYSHVFTTATAIVEFILPFVCLTLLNVILYFKIKKRSKIAPGRNTQAGCQTSNSSSNDAINLRVVRPSTLSKDNHSPAPESTTNSFNNKDNIDKKEILQSKLKSERPFNKYRLNNKGLERSVSVSRSKSHLRAAKFLAILVVAFIVFWAPYTITTMAISFCNNCINTSLYEFFNWLLWMKSAVNPLLYAFNSRRYRKFIVKYLTLNGKLWKRNIGQIQART
ncbi:muscarinic acetylcholine receptor M3-like [Mercenaria mercenaria]|uniref:muscarinic acetylcholine receptor M3-like n=1 Tax=Mercenaria mercenaria TaxID=6596 RepID=UPI00234F9ABA|nr:muscarinic acetylcholine receptor M3-like [Mercenaria mercenaria]